MTHSNSAQASLSWRADVQMLQLSNGYFVMVSLSHIKGTVHVKRKHLVIIDSDGRGSSVVSRTAFSETTEIDGRLF